MDDNLLSILAMSFLACATANLDHSNRVILFSIWSISVRQCLLWFLD